MEFYYSKDAGLVSKDALSFEWLETNQFGSYASSTLLNCHTRKYHGLLVSAIPGLPDKFVLLSMLDDVLTIDGQDFPLTAHQYEGAFQDGSFESYQQFSVTTHPAFMYRFEELILSKEILLLSDENTVLIRYKLKGGGASKVKLRLRPLLAYRSFHALTHANESLAGATTACLHGVSMTPYAGMPSIYLQFDQENAFTPDLCWYKNFAYHLERERGFDCNEDLFCPGVFEFSFAGRNDEIIFVASLNKNTIAAELKNKWEREIDLRVKDFAAAKGAVLQEALQKSGSTMLSRHPEINTTGVTAGFHWFLEWGRDAMISLPGLTLYREAYADCLAVLTSFAREERLGLIPNYLGKSSAENAYNTVDASLWFAWAVQQYYLKTHDLVGIKNNLWDALKNIFNHYKNGTSYDIRVAGDNLLYAGSDAEQHNLTWMDAKVNGVPVTPRVGAPVEVNALWYNFLRFMLVLSSKLHDPLRKTIKPMARAHRKAFAAAFWDEKLGYLKDFISQTNPTDPATLLMRPNQIFAISLPYSPVSKKIAKKVVTVVTNHLLTSYGLRTLAPGSSNYCAEYQGGVAERDAAYHNGTVWPWLLGSYTEALIKVKGRTKARRILEPSLKAFEKHLYEYGIGSIAEIFSAEEPHKPNGCIAQAWSVAEVLRMTYLLGISK